MTQTQAETLEWMRQRIEALETAARGALEWFAQFGDDCGSDFMRQTASENYQRLDSLFDDEHQRGDVSRSYDGPVDDVDKPAIPEWALGQKQ